MRLDVTSNDCLSFPKIISTSSAEAPASFITLSILYLDNSAPNMPKYQDILPSLSTKAFLLEKLILVSCIPCRVTISKCALAPTWVSISSKYARCLPLGATCGAYISSTIVALDPTSATIIVLVIEDDPSSAKELIILRGSSTTTFLG